MYLTDIKQTVWLITEGEKRRISFVTHLWWTAVWVEWWRLLLPSPLGEVQVLSWSPSYLTPPTGSDPSDWHSLPPAAASYRETSDTLREDSSAGLWFTSTLISGLRSVALWWFSVYSNCKSMRYWKVSIDIVLRRNFKAFSFRHSSNWCHNKSCTTDGKNTSQR